MNEDDIESCLHAMRDLRNSEGLRGTLLNWNGPISDDNLS